MVRAVFRMVVGSFSTTVLYSAVGAPTVPLTNILPRVSCRGVVCRLFLWQSRWRSARGLHGLCK